MRRFCSCSSTCPGVHLVLASRSDPPLPLARLRRPGSLPSCAAAICDLPLRRRPRCCGNRLAMSCPADGGGGAGGSHRRGRRRAAAGRAIAARTAPTWPGSWRPSADLPLRLGLPDRRGAGGPDRPGARVLAGDLGAGPAIGWAVRRGHRPHRRPGDAGAGWSGRTCSWCRWMRCAAGGVTTTCSPTCSAPACSSSSPAGWRACTRTRQRGMRSVGWPMTRSGTRWPRGTRPGPPG